MKRFVLFFLFLIIAIALLFLYKPLKNRIIEHFRGPSITNICPGCDLYFPDGISVHERAYRKEGIKKQKSFKQLEILYIIGILSKIQSNEYYLVDDMQDSRPYVLHKVVIFLDDLSIRYKEALEKRKINYFPFTVTSGTRSVESVRELQKKNKIAIENSPHLHGKTIDISYRRFGQDPNCKSVFIEVLKELRDEKKCYVKFEKFEQGALHLTVR